MNKIDYTMVNIVRKLKGKILGFSIENDKILNELKENANIVEVNILSNNESSKGNIGRKKGIITDNFGPHSKNSARKINKIDLTYANGKKYTERDKKILQAVVEAHEGKDKNMDKICRKYQIGEEDIEYTTQMMKIIKDKKNFIPENDKI